MAFTRPLTETLYSGQQVCSLCGGPCNGWGPEPTHAVLGEGDVLTALAPGGGFRMYDDVRPQPAHPMDTNGEIDADPKVV